MTMEQVMQVLTLLQCEYPGSFSQLDERGMTLKMELWAKEFANDEYNIVFAAIRTYMRTPERFAPSIGQVREIMTSLTAGEDMLSVRARVDWHEKHKMLKLAYPMALSQTEAIYEIPFGHITRPDLGAALIARDGQEFQLKAQGWKEEE